ncbi:TPA: ABC-three component system middle component 6 [Escherichia coli]
MSSNAYSYVDIIDLYNEFKSKNNNPSFTQYIYTLNWLYLLGLIDANENGDLILCF